MMFQTDEILAYSIKDAAKAVNTGQTKIYEQIRLGKLKAVKFGKRTLVPAASLKEWLNNLPCMGDKK